MSFWVSSMQPFYFLLSLDFLVFNFHQAVDGIQEQQRQLQVGKK